MTSDQDNPEVDKLLERIISLDTQLRTDELGRISQRDPILGKQLRERLVSLQQASPYDDPDEVVPDHNAARILYAGRRGISAGLAVFALFFVHDWVGKRWVDEPDSILFGAHVLILVVASFALCVYWFFPNPSYKFLRICEKFCLAAAILFQLAYQFVELRSYAPNIVGSSFVTEGLRGALNDSFSLRWAMLVFLYILFVPRPQLGNADEKSYRIWPTIVLVCVIGILPQILTIGFFYWVGDLHDVPGMCFESILWMFAAAAPAVYGHYVVEGTIRGERILGAWGNLRKIGSGGFATVYKATHRSYTQDVAVKFIKQKYLNSRAAVKLFQSEAQAMARLSHPHLVRIYHYDPGFDDLAYIVMEFVDGQTIEQIVQLGGPMPVERVIPILRQVLSALHEIHSNGMLHRDITPQNVMLCRFAEIEDFVKVLDLGIILPALEYREAEKNDSPLFTVGNPRYMSPEQERCDRDLDERCDIFCVGALAYRMLTARYLNLDRFSQTSEGGQEPRQLLLECGCPTDLSELVLRCTELDREKRFANAHEVVRALDQIPHQRPT